MWDNWAKKFSSHLLPPKITVLARKWRKGRCVSLPTNKLFEGLYLALLEKFLQKELRVFLYFKTGSKPSAVLLLTYASLASLAWGAGGEWVNSTKRLWLLLALGTRIFLIWVGNQSSTGLINTKYLNNYPLGHWWNKYHHQFILGKEDQPDTVPQKIYLKLRHLSGSFFRVPADKSEENLIKQYYQPVASYRTIKYNRFTLSDMRECKKRKDKNTGEKWHLN